MLWARLIRGSISSPKAVTLRRASALTVLAWVAGCRKLIRTELSGSSLTSASVGAWTSRTTSAPLKSSPASAAIFAPASSYARSEKVALAPAPAWTQTSSPAWTSLPAVSGTRATRRSPGSVSLGTATFTPRECTVSWEPEAENWLLWARTPGHDAYWHYRDSFFSAIVPPAGRLTLEVRSGEGRVARDLAERGHRVVGIDTSPTLVRHAAEADDRGRYLVAAAEALPFAAASFDLVVAYNALMDVDDLEASVREAARVLEPGGRLSVSVTP